MDSPVNGYSRITLPYKQGYIFQIEDSLPQAEIQNFGADEQCPDEQYCDYYWVNSNPTPIQGVLIVMFLLFNSSSYIFLKVVGGFPNQRFFITFICFLASCFWSAKLLCFLLYLLPLGLVTWFSSPIKFPTWLRFHKK